MWSHLRRGGAGLVVRPCDCWSGWARRLVVSQNGVRPPSLGSSSVQQQQELLVRRRDPSSFGGSTSWFSSSADKKQDDQEDEETTATTTLSPLQVWQDQTLKGVGQVIFLNSTQSGAAVLASLAVGDFYLASLAVTGTVVATATAKHVLQVPETPGLWGYNGCLVGCMTAVFVAPDAPFVGFLSTIPGAAASTVVAATLPSFCGTMPQWTYAFNLVALTQLLRLQPFLAATPDEEAAAAVATAATSSPLYGVLVEAPLHGLSQIFVVENTLSGAGILLGIAAYSPQLAGYAVTGSVVGALTGLLCYGAPLADVTAGLWGYNPALTAMGVAVFFRNDDNKTLATLAVGGAVATAAVFGAMQPVFGMAGSPCLTLPFCLVMTGVYHTAHKIPGLALAANPHSPEKNT